MTVIITGTISVDANSTSVTGSGTNWGSTVKPGDMLVVGLSFGFAGSIESDTALTLEVGWPGGDVVNGAYYISPMGVGFGTIETNRLLAEYVAALRAGTLFKPDASGALAERDDYDDEGQGFFYLDPSVDPHQLYTKLSDTSGDWNGGTDWPQSGEDGIDGDPGADGISPTIDWNVDEVVTVDVRSTFPASTAISGKSNSGHGVYAYSAIAPAIRSIGVVQAGIVSTSTAGYGGEFSSADYYGLKSVGYLGGGLLTRQILKTNPGIKIIALSMHPEKQYVLSISFNTYDYF